MTATAGYVGEDHGYVESLFRGWTPDPLPSPNWLGIVKENEAFPGEGPKPSGPDQSTVFAVWALDYQQVEASYDPTIAPYRRGTLLISCFEEHSARGGPARLLMEALQRRALEAPDDGPIYLDIPNARPERVGPVSSSFYAFNLRIPFAGG